MIRKYEDFINEGNDEENKDEKPLSKKPARQDEDDMEYLNRMLGSKFGDEEEPPKKSIDPTAKKKVMDYFEDEYKRRTDPLNTSEIVEGDRIVYYKDGSENNGKKGIFVGYREDGKARVVFEDGKKFVALAKNVYPEGTAKPSPKVKKVAPDHYDIPEDRLGRDEWGPGSFDLPDTFYGGKKPERPNTPTKSAFKKGDKVKYTNSKSEHNNKTARFIEQREDGKVSIRFDDGGKFACNPKNIVPFSIELPKEDFIIRLGMNPENQIEAGVFLDSGDMYDEHITEQYPELIKMGFEEPAEGDLLYDGGLELEELAKDLEERGFRVELAEGKLY